MSLVHEALRKAEREKQRKVGNASQASQPAAPQPVHTPPAHTPAAPAPVIVVTRDAVPHNSASETADVKEPNHFLLPALIACVAIVAIIAIVFLVSSASSVLHQAKESPTTTAAVAAPVPPVKATTPAEPQPATQPSASTPAEPAAPVVTPPPAATAADGSKFVLTGIMQDPDGKFVAIINGHVTYEGSSVGGATVKSIDREHAVLEINGHETPLRLF